MTGRTHAAISVTCGLSLIILYKAQPYEALSSSIIGAMSLDIDTKKSTISSMFPLINKPVDSLTKHRGLIHWGIPLLLMTLYLIKGEIYFLYLGIGALSHLCIDMITKAIGVTCNSRGEGYIYNLLWFINMVLVSQMVYPDWWKSIVERVI